MYNLDKIRIDVRNFCRDINKEWYLNWAGLKDEARAWIFEAQLRNFLGKEYGDEWFNNRETGEFLMNIWANGQKHSIVELARMIGYSGLNIKPLIESLRRHLN